MKKMYIKPIIIDNTLEKSIIPVGAVGAVGMLAGYAAARAVTNAVKAQPVVKLRSLLSKI